MRQEEKNSFSSTATIVQPDAARLRFALRFARLDLAALCRGDWLTVQADLRQFLGEPSGPTDTYKPVPVFGAGVYAVATDGQGDEYTLKTLQDLQAEVRALLSTFLMHPRGHAYTACTPQVTWRIVETQGKGQLYAEGKLRDVFLIILLTLLAYHPDRVRECPECGTWFYRVKQQTFCSRLCSTRVSVRDWRARQNTHAAPA
jgi:hypothetical protein